MVFRPMYLLFAFALVSPPSIFLPHIGMVQLLYHLSIRDPSTSQGTGGPSYIYSRYKGLDSNELPEEAFPVTFSKDGYRTRWIDTFLSS